MKLYEHYSFSNNVLLIANGWGWEVGFDRFILCPTYFPLSLQVIKQWERSRDEHSRRISLFASHLLYSLDGKHLPAPPGYPLMVSWVKLTTTLLKASFSV